MAVNYSKFGTRISLSERFALIRKENQNRSKMLNQTIEFPSLAANRNIKNFNETFSRADRPSALLQQGSERNKRLIQQMAVAPTVLAELNSSFTPAYNPQIYAQLPQISPNPPQLRVLPQYRAPQPLRAAPQQQLVPQQQLRAPQLRNVQQSISQRLGTGRNLNGSNLNNGTSPKSIKSRLGVKRVPINQRIGPRPVQNGLQNNRNINNRLHPRNSVVFKRKAQLAPKFNQLRPQVKKLVKPQMQNQKPVGIKPKPVTTQQLDQDLDVYMRKTKGYLNADLDAYMSQA